jgi:hypothetical protein
MYYGYSLPAPVGGLNLIDSIDRLDEIQALELQNLFPNGQRVELAGGYEVFGTQSVTTNPVKSLFDLPLADGTNKLVACGNALLSDMTSGTEVDVTGSTTPTSDEWIGVVFNNRLFLANGADVVQVWAGTSTFANSTFTGVTLSDLSYVTSHRERLYFIEKNSGSVWYGNVKAIGSSGLTEVDFSYFLKRGGNLVACGSFPNQVQQSDEIFFVLSSEGELLLYSGSYPGAAEWQIVSRFYIGKPLSKRCLIELQNDTWIITSDGLIPISLLFQSGASFAANSVSRNINPVIRQYAKTVPFSYLWQGHYWQNGNRVYLNIPISSSDSKLYVCNIETGAWCNYYYSTAGIVHSLTSSEANMFYGSTAGNIRQAEEVSTHDGQPIPIALKYGFNYFGDRMSFKRFIDVRPLVFVDGETTLTLGIDTDYRNIVNSDTISISSSSITPWGSPWGSPWGADPTLSYDRYAIQGQGHSGALKITGTADTASLEFYAFELGIEKGARV